MRGFLLRRVQNDYFSRKLYLERVKAKSQEIRQQMEEYARRTAIEDQVRNKGGDDYTYIRKRRKKLLELNFQR